MAKRIVPLLLFSLAATANAAPFEQGNVQTGKKVFDEKDCYGCHLKDGKAFFERPKRIVHNPQQLMDRLEGYRWIHLLTEQDMIDIAAWLNQNYYKFQ